MNKKDLEERIARGERLSLLEQAVLDATLSEDEAQQRVARLLGNLPREEPSLAWRSRLNERIYREASKPLRGVSWLRAGLIVSAAACALVVATVVIQVPRSNAVPSVASELLVQWHEEAAASVALPADGSSMTTFTIAEQAPIRNDEVEDLLYGDSLDAL
jgi:hypothetical protein